MQRIGIKILVVLFSLIALTLAKDLNVNQENVRDIISSNEVKKERIDDPFDFTTKEAFDESIRILRTRVATSALNVENMLISNANGNMAYTLINFGIPVAGNVRSLQLVMLTENLYITGFVNDYQGRRTFSRFSDPEFSRLEVAGTTLRQLPSYMQTTYGSLTSMAGMSLRNVNIDQFTLENSLRLLYNFGAISGDQSNFGRAMLRVIILTAESARFNPIQQDLGQCIGEYRTYILGDDGQRLLNNWGGFSNYAIRLEDNPQLTDPLRPRRPVYGVDVFNRNNLFLAIAVALNCRPRYHRTDTCPAEEDIILINNTYWFKDDIINYVF